MNEITTSKSFPETKIQITTDGKLGVMFCNSPFPSLIYDKKFIDANQAVVSLLKFESKEELLDNISSVFLSEEKQNDDFFTEPITNANENGSHTQEYQLKNKDNKEIPVSVSFTKISTGNEDSFLVTLLDLTKQKRLRKEINAAEKEIMTGMHEVILTNIELERQKDEILARKNEIERKNKAITSSLQYARRIQNALLPPEKHVAEILPDHFVFYRPRDIVSGDFFWMERVVDKIVVAVADSTGHGVPGAFMSMLGLSFLSDVVNKLAKNSNLYANVILNELRQKVKNTLRQTGSMDDRKDGMDMAICIIDAANRQMQFAGAYNPVILIRNDEMRQYKGDPMPISVFHKERPFRNQIIKLEQNDIIYMFSDGFMDQFGKETDKKYGKKQFRELLHRTSKIPIDIQKKALIKELDEWQRDKDQLDDIIIVGIQFDFNKIENIESVSAHNWIHKTILIAEDDEFSLLFLKDLLFCTGVNIISSITGLEAVQKFEENKDVIDAVLMDIDLPEMSGYDAIKEIKKIKAHIPVIVQTAFIFRDEQEAYDAGCNDYITKPVDSEILFKLLGKYF